MKPRQLNDNDRSVLGALGRSEKPLSAYDILDRARSDALKAPVQVYRALESSRAGLVHRIEALNAFVACSDHDHPRPHVRASSSAATAGPCASSRTSELQDRRGGGRRRIFRRARFARGLRPMRGLPGG